MVWTLHIRQRHKNPLKHFNRIQTMNVGRWSELERKDEAFPCILKSKQSRQQKVTPGATLSPWLRQMFLQGCLSFQPINGAFLHGDVKDKILKTSQFRIESNFLFNTGWWMDKIHNNQHKKTPTNQPYSRTWIWLYLLVTHIFTYKMLPGSPISRFMDTDTWY